MPNGLPDGAELAYYVKGQVWEYSLNIFHFCMRVAILLYAIQYMTCLRVCFRNYLEVTNREAV